MRYYTKEWYKLMEFVGISEMYEPVIDKEYTEEEIEILYQDMLDKYVQEAHTEYDEPPFFIIDGEDGFDPEDFDPEEMEEELEEYENRPPFDEEEAAEDFREEYKDNLEEPDESLPEWVRAEVDPRLIALWVLPESVYKRLVAEDKEKEAIFDKMDEAADEALETAAEALPESCEDLPDELDELDGDYVIEAGKVGADYEVVLCGWDDEGDEAINVIKFKDAEVIEDEGLNITSEKDEDGDTVSDCDMLYHEVYYEDGAFEVHLLMENETLKYLTVRCSEVSIERR